jgi:hypothetical protein
MLFDDHQPRFPTSQTTIRADYGVVEPGASLVHEISREEGFVCLAFILDACSHKMVG